MGHKVYIPQPIAEEGKRFLLERGYELKLGTATDEQAMIAEIADCDAALARTEIYTADVIKAGTKLKVIARHGVGIDNVDLAAATAQGIWVTTTPLANAISVAEHVLGAIFALAKQILPIESAFRAGSFAIRNQITGVDLEGKTLGIVGLGKIGSLLARKAAAGLAMRVVAYDPFVRQSAAPDGVEMLDEQDEVFRQADFLSLHVPSLPETVGLVGRDKLALMKPTAYLINASRGEVIRENELAEALRQGVIAGAALDVFEQEPPEPDNPLLAMAQVIPTPHTAAMTQESKLRMALHAAKCIDEVLSGQAPSWPANRPQTADAQS